MVERTDYESLLSGIGVLELGSSFIAGPLATRTCADFGAEVVDRERPGRCDKTRDWRKLRGTSRCCCGRSTATRSRLWSKLSAEPLRELLLDLVRASDVMVENFRQGALEKLGLDLDSLTAANPDVVVVRISNYGQTGPYRARARFGVNGFPDRPSVRPTAPPSARPPRWATRSPGSSMRWRRSCSYRPDPAACRTTGAALGMSPSTKPCS